MSGYDWAEHRRKWTASMQATGYFAKPDEERCDHIIVLSSMGAAFCLRPAGHDGDHDTVAFDEDLS